MGALEPRGAADAPRTVAAPPHREDALPARGRDEDPHRENGRGDCLRDGRGPRGGADLPPRVRALGDAEAREAPVGLLAHRRRAPQGPRRAPSLARVRLPGRCRTRTIARRLARGPQPLARVLALGQRLAFRGPRADSHARDARRAGARDPELRARGLHRGPRDVHGIVELHGSPLQGPRGATRARGQAPPRDARGPRRGGRRPGPGEDRHRDGLLARLADEALPGAVPLRPHRAAAPCEPALRLERAEDARGRAAALRGEEGPHVPAHRQPASLGRRREDAAVGARRAASHLRRALRQRRGRCGRGYEASGQALRRRHQGHRPPRAPSHDRRGHVGFAGRRREGALRPRGTAAAHGLARGPRHGRDPRRRGGDAEDRENSRGPLPRDRHDRPHRGLEGPRPRTSRQAPRNGRGRRDAASTRARQGRAPRRRRGERAREEDPPAEALHRRVAPHGHGNRGKAPHGGRARAGDEGERPRHAGNPRRDPRDAHHAPLRRARRQGLRRDGKGHPAHRDRAPRREEPDPHGPLRSPAPARAEGRGGPRAVPPERRAVGDRSRGAGEEPSRAAGGARSTAYRLRASGAAFPSRRTWRPRSRNASVCLASDRTRRKRAAPWCRAATCSS